MNDVVELIKRLNELAREIAAVEAEIERNLRTEYNITAPKRTCAWLICLEKRPKRLEDVLEDAVIVGEQVRLEIRRLTREDPEAAKRIKEYVEKLELFVSLLEQMGYGRDELTYAIKRRPVTAHECAIQGNC